MDHVATMPIKDFNKLPMNLKDILREERRKHKHKLKMRRLRSSQKHRVEILANEGAAAYAGTKVTEEGDKLVFRVVDEDSPGIVHRLGSESVQALAKLLQRRAKYQGKRKKRHTKEVYRR